jgi:hypothetical protein
VKYLQTHGDVAFYRRAAPSQHTDRHHREHRNRGPDTFHPERFEVFLSRDGALWQLWIGHRWQDLVRVGAAADPEPNPSFGAHPRPATWHPPRARQEEPDRQEGQAW